MKLRIPTAFLFFFLFSLACAGACLAFSKEMSGKDADEFMATLRITPYVPAGHGKKVVYVFGRYSCSTTRAFYQLSKKLHDEFEFRWLIEPRVARDDDSIGLYESRSPEALDKIFGAKIPVPAHNEKIAMAQAALVELIPEVLAKRAGISGPYSLPTLAFRTESSVMYLSANHDLLNEQKLRVLLAPALPDTKKTPFDVNAAFTAVAKSTPMEGYFCTRGVAVYPRLLPNEKSPLLGTSLDPDKCYYARSTVPGGWIGIKLSGGSKVTLGYVKETEGILP